MKNVTCPYCGRLAEYCDSKIVYRGKSFGMIYICRPCDAYVGVHKGSDKPLGRLANAQLRRWKQAAHAAFDPLWKSGRMSRSGAYKWLAARLGIPASMAHIGMFDVDQCMKVVIVSNEERRRA